MTRSTPTNKDSFDGTGANTVLATTFKFIDAADLVVTRRVTATGVETTMVLTTDYTVTGGSHAIGTVTPVNGATDFPSTVEWTIERNTPPTQATDYVENDNFGAETHEKALDKLTDLAVDRQEQVNRSFKVPVTDSNPGEVPNSVDRASQYFGFDAAGDPIALDAPTDTAIVTAFMETVLDDGSAAVARATLEAQEDVITTQGDVIRGSSGAVAERLALGASGTYLRSDGTDVSFSALVAADVDAVVALPRNYLSGLPITHTSTTLLDVGVGECRAGSGADPNLGNFANTTAAFGKTFVDPSGTPWASGDGNPGIPAAAGFAASIATWHYFALLGTDGSVDFGYDTSVVAANLIADAAVQAALTSTVYYRRLYSFRSTATPNIPAFLQHGDTFLLDASVQDISAGSPGVNVVSHTLSSVPTGLRVEALVSIIVTLGGASFTIIGHGDISTLAAPGSGRYDIATDAAGGALKAHWSGAVLTNTSAVIKTHSSADPTTLDIEVKGWIDHRGKDD